MVPELTSRMGPESSQLISSFGNREFPDQPMNGDSLQEISTMSGGMPDPEKQRACDEEDTRACMEMLETMNEAVREADQMGPFPGLGVELVGGSGP